MSRGSPRRSAGRRVGSAAAGVGNVLRSGIADTDIVLTNAAFKKCLMSLAANEGYNDWLLGRAMSDRDRPAADLDLAFVAIGTGDDAVHQDPVIEAEIGRLT